MPISAFQQIGDKCEFCIKKYDKKETTTIEDIIKLAEKSEGKYDCIVPISGGRDSAYVLYYAKKILNLNPLAVNFNNTFMTEGAKENINLCVEKLDVDYVSYSFKGNYFRNLMKQFFVKNGEFCSPCNASKKYFVKKAAYLNNVKLVIRGISTKLDNNFGDENFHKIFDDGIDNYAENISDFSTDKEREEYQDFISMNSWGRDIVFIDLPNIIEWDYDKINQVLKSECGWKVAPETFFHKDCKLLPVLYYMQTLKFGYSDQQVFLSNLMNYGISKKEDLLPLMRSEEVTQKPDETSELAKIFDLSDEEFSSIVESKWGVKL